MRGVSTLVVLILLVLIAISLAGAVYVWASDFAFRAYPEDELEQDYQKSRACISLEDINGTAGTATIRNCGFVPLSDIALYVDSSEISFTYPDILDPNAEVAVTFTQLSAGEHTYFALADLTETPTITVTNS